MVCAAVIPTERVEDVRDALRPLRLRGQVKLHWTDESSSRRRKIVGALSALGPMTAMVSHVSQRQKKTERFRRKCLETLYYELHGMGIHGLLCESRTQAQNRKDIAHVVGLRSQGLSADFRIAHARGGDEPLLWIPDIFLGAVNAAVNGEAEYLETLKPTLILEARTPASL